MQTVYVYKFWDSVSKFIIFIGWDLIVITFVAFTFIIITIQTSANSAGDEGGESEDTLYNATYDAESVLGLGLLDICDEVGWHFSVLIAALVGKR